MRPPGSDVFGGTGDPRVAVIMPCYNSSRFVADAIRSVLTQDYPLIDIIVIDDGSPDDLGAAIRPFADRIRLIVHDRNRGMAQARNTGIDATETPLIAFLDPDDRWRPSKVRVQVEYLRQHPECGLVYVRSSTINAMGEPLDPEAADRLPAIEDTWEGVLRRCPFLSSQAMVRRSVLANDRFRSDASPVEDWDLWFRLAARTSFGACAQTLVEWRRHEGNFSGDQAKVRRGVLRMLTQLEQTELPGPRRAAIRARIARVRQRIARLDRSPQQVSQPSPV